MIGNTARDAPGLPALAEVADPRAVPRPRHATCSGRRRQRAALGHALAFSTWRSLAREQGCQTQAAAALIARIVA